MKHDVSAESPGPSSAAASAPHSPVSTTTATSRGVGALERASAKLEALDVEAMSVKDLRVLIRRGGMNDAGCVEKADLVAHALQARTRLLEAATLRRRNGSTMVRLAVYDLSHGWARILSPIFLCRKIDIAPHTSIIIYGKEFFWGGSIQRMSHEDFVEQSGQRPVEIIDLGETEIEEQLFNDFILDVSGRYTQHTYDILRNNCNNFSEECAQFLLGRSIPAHILAAPDQLRTSCLGRAVLFCCGLSALVRTTLLLVFTAALGAAALVVLAALEPGMGVAGEDGGGGGGGGSSGGGGQGCPVAGGEDDAVTFALVVLAMDVAYTAWQCACLGAARACGRKVLWLAPWVEATAPPLLALLAYSSCVSLSTLHAATPRYFPGRCTRGDANYAKLSAGVGLAWAGVLVALLGRLVTRVSGLVDDLAEAAAAAKGARGAAGDGRPGGEQDTRLPGLELRDSQDREEDAAAATAEAGGRLPMGPSSEAVAVAVRSLEEQRGAKGASLRAHPGNGTELPGP